MKDHFIKMRELQKNEMRAGGLGTWCCRLRLHDVRGERSNVPRDNAALYGAGDFATDKMVIV